MLANCFQWSNAFLGILHKVVIVTCIREIKHVHVFNEIIRSQCPSKVYAKEYIR